VSTSANTAPSNIILDGEIPGGEFSSPCGLIRECPLHGFEQNIQWDHHQVHISSPWQKWGQVERHQLIFGRNVEETGRTAELSVGAEGSRTLIKGFKG
jgi:hypothetical protein